MVSNDAMYAAVVADKPHTLTMLYDPEDCNSRQLFRVIAELTRTDDGMNAMNDAAKKVWNVALVDATSATRLRIQDSATSHPKPRPKVPVGLG